MTMLAARPPLTETEHKLRTAQDLFIRRWGEMGATWGINRTQAEIHALCYITGQPLCTDDVMERLNISRGNASMSLRALCDWLGIEFTDRMLHWPKGPRDSDGIWAPHWYAHVWESTGFEAPVAREVVLSGEAAEVAGTCRAHYERLHALRMVVDD